MGKGKKQRIKNSTDFSIQKDQTQPSPEIQSIALRVKATIGKKKKNTLGFLLWHWTLEDRQLIYPHLLLLQPLCFHTCQCRDIGSEKGKWMKGYEKPDCQFFHLPAAA